MNKWILSDFNKKEFFLSILIPICLVVLEVLQLKVMFYVILALSVVLISKPLVIFPGYYIASLSPTYFGTGEGTSISRYLSVILIASFIFHIINRNKKHLKSGSYTVLLIVYSLFSCLFSFTGSLEPFFLMIQNLLVFLLLQQQEEVNTKTLYTSLFVSSLIVLGGLWYQMIWSGAALYEERYSVEDVNTNRLAMMCEQIAALSLFPFFVSKNFSLKFFSLIVFIAGVMMTFLSGSRSAMIGVMGSVTVLLLILSKRNIKHAFIPVILLLIVTYVLVGYLDQMDTTLSQRFRLDTLRDSGSIDARLVSHRIILYNIFPHHMLFGVGMGGKNILEAGKQFSLVVPAHNIIIDPISQLGIIGFVLFIVPIVKVLRKSIHILSINNTLKPMACMVLLLVFAAIFNGMGEVIFYEKLFWNDLALGALLVNLSYKSGASALS